MDKAPTIVLILILLALLLVIAFSSGTEVAMLSVNRYRIRHRASLGERRARLLERLLQQPDRWLGANLVILALRQRRRIHRGHAAGAAHRPAATPSR